MLMFGYLEPISLAKASQMTESKLKEQKDDKEHGIQEEAKNQSSKLSLSKVFIVCSCSAMSFPWVAHISHFFKYLYKINFVLFNNEDTEVEGFSMTYSPSNTFSKIQLELPTRPFYPASLCFSDYSNLNFFLKPCYCSALCKCLLLIKDNQRQTL